MKQNLVVLVHDLHTAKSTQYLNWTGFLNMRRIRRKGIVVVGGKELSKVMTSISKQPELEKRMHHIPSFPQFSLSSRRVHVSHPFSLLSVAHVREQGRDTPARATVSAPGPCAIGHGGAAAGGADGEAPTRA